MWFLCLAFCDIWGDRGENVLWCRAIIHHISFSSHFVFPFANLRKSILALCYFDAEQNNFPKISETSCLPQNFSIYCSFVMLRALFFRMCFRFFFYFASVYISTCGLSLMRKKNSFDFFRCKGLKWLREKLNIRVKRYSWRRLKFSEFIEKANLRLNIFKNMDQVWGCDDELGS